jgi:hypothetical protein
MAEPTRKDLFTELIKHLIALIKDRDHDNLTLEQRTKARTRAFELAEQIGAWFDE